MSWMTRLTPAARIGSQSTSPPTSPTSSSIRCSVDAIVNSRTGAPSVTVGDQQAGCTRGEVAADRVDAAVHAGHALHQHAVGDVGDELGLRPRAGHQLQGQAPHPRRALEATADCVAGADRAGARERCRTSARSCAAHRRRSSTLRRAARPSPSSSVAVYACGLVGSSTSVNSGLATGSSMRSRNRLRPLMTDSPFRVPEMTPKNCAVTNGSSTTVNRLLGGLVEPSSRVARSDASRAAFSRSKSSGERPTLNPKPVCVSSPSSASVLTLT